MALKGTVTLELGRMQCPDAFPDLTPVFFFTLDFLFLIKSIEY